MMIIGVISIITSAVLFTRIDIPWLSVVFYSLYGIGRQLMMISTNTFIANETKKGEHRTKGFSGNYISSGIARAVVPIMCGYLLQIDALNYDWLFTIISGFGLIALVLVFVLRLSYEETPEEEIDYAKELSEKSGDDYSNMNGHSEGKKTIRGVLISFGLGRMLMGFASGVAIPFLSWYILNEFPVSEDLWGWISASASGLQTFGYIFMAFFAEKIGKGLIVVIFWSLVIPTAVGIMLAPSLLWVSIFYVLRAFFAMTPAAAWNSFLFEWMDPQHRGKILGLLQTGQRTTRATGTLLGGLAYGALGAMIFPICMTAYPVAGLLPLIMSFIVKKKLNIKTPEEEEEEVAEKKYESAEYESMETTADGIK